MCVYVSSKFSDKHTDLVEEKDKIQSKGDEQSQEPKVVEVARKIVLGREGKEVRHEYKAFNCLISWH